ncbi:hypothetical protein LQ419_01680 [Gordonia paraffinivorans]|nr:hypothetical protein [Gordonia paraffinivorans]
MLADSISFEDISRVVQSAVSDAHKGAASASKDASARLVAATARLERDLPAAMKAAAGEIHLHTTPPTVKVDADKIGERAADAVRRRLAEPVPLRRAVIAVAALAVLAVLFWYGLSLCWSVLRVWVWGSVEWWVMSAAAVGGLLLFGAGIVYCSWLAGLKSVAWLQTRPWRALSTIPRRARIWYEEHQR